MARRAVRPDRARVQRGFRAKRVRKTLPSGAVSSTPAALDALADVLHQLLRLVGGERDDLLRRRRRRARTRDPLHAVLAKVVDLILQRLQVLRRRLRRLDLLDLLDPRRFVALALLLEAHAVALARRRLVVRDGFASVDEERGACGARV